LLVLLSAFALDKFLDLVRRAIQHLLQGALLLLDIRQLVLEFALGIPVNRHAMTLRFRRQPF
jgi:hypothetical protein